jgi:hypothetical protein
LPIEVLLLAAAALPPKREQRRLQLAKPDGHGFGKNT